jgi:putative acetyltransferase
LNVKPITSISKDVEVLLQQSRQYMAELYPADSVHQVDTDHLLESDVYFIGGYLDRALMGIGAVKIFDSSPRYGEIKNLFVDPEYRGRGLSRLIMNALEQHLVDQQITICRLETGVSQPESISLYRSLGYHERTSFGDYKLDPLSIFMQKNLDTC